jgi:hypothetical protein
MDLILVDRIWHLIVLDVSLSGELTVTLFTVLLAAEDWERLSVAEQETEV